MPDVGVTCFTLSLHDLYGEDHQDTDTPILCPTPKPFNEPNVGLIKQHTSLPTLMTLFNTYWILRTMRCTVAGINWYATLIIAFSVTNSICLAQM
jgi:hypothetical protein